MASDRHLKALGLVTYNSGQLEVFAREALIILVGDRPVGTILVGDRSLDQILELILRIGPVRVQHQDELLARLVTAVESARDANRLRNDLVHSHWALTDEESSLLRGRRQRGKRASVVTMRRTTPDEIGAVANQIRDATQRLGEAMMEYQKVNPPQDI